MKDINPGSANGEPLNLLNVDGTVFFQANDGATGIELWKTNGTDAGTVLVKDIFPGPENSNPANLTNVNGVLYFTANDGTTGVELWKSDGTPTGTVLVAKINPTPGSVVIDPDTGLPIVTPPGGSSPFGLTVFNGEVYFQANDGTSGNELWKSDGTEAGTVQVKDINAGAGNSSPGLLAVLNDVLYFRASDGTVAPAAGTELWKTDGTTAGTARVADINPGTANSSLADMVVFNGALFFAASNGTVAPNGLGTELWTSDGTAAGTVLVKDIRTGTVGSTPQRLVVSGGILYFLATDGTVAPGVGQELWKSAGTAAGTVPLVDLNPGSGPSVARSFTKLNDIVLFSAFEPTHRNELWRTDALAAEVADFDASHSSDISLFRPSTGAWYVNGGTDAFWGDTGDIPVPGDYTGDGKADIAVYRPSTGAWYVNGASNAFWGDTGDVPVPGDYTGDGKADIAVYRPSTGAWYVNGASNAFWGDTGDVPLPLPFAIAQSLSVP